MGDDPLERVIRLEHDSWARARHIVEIAALLAAGIWAFYTFVYEEKIKPAQTLAAPSITISYLPGGVRRGVRLFDVSVRITNRSPVPIDEIAELFTFSVGRFDTSAARGRFRKLRWGFEVDNTVPIAHWSTLYEHAELRTPAQNGPPHSHIFIEGNDSFVFDFPLTVPEGKFDVVQADVHLAFTHVGENGRHLATITRGARSSHLTADTGTSDLTSVFLL